MLQDPGVAKDPRTSRQRKKWTQTLLDFMTVLVMVYLQTYFKIPFWRSTDYMFIIVYLFGQCHNHGTNLWDKTRSKNHCRLCITTVDIKWTYLEYHWLPRMSHLFAKWILITHCDPNCIYTTEIVRTKISRAFGSLMAYRDFETFLDDDFVGEISDYL